MAELQVADRQPQYVEEVEAILRASAFYDEERADALRDNIAVIDPAELGARSLLYARTLRLIAEERHKDRKIARANGAEVNDSLRLTHRYLGVIAFRNQETVHEISRQLALINNVERYIAENADASLRPDQAEFLEEIMEFMQSRPKSTVIIDRNTNRTYERYVNGATVVAPTGSGKTAIMAQTAVALGIGEVPSAADKKPLRLLIVVPSQDLIEQFTGKSGDNTFGRFAPNMTVSGYYQYEKDASADVVVITKDKFIAEFRDGMLGDQKFDTIMIDEVHRLTEPAFYDTFQTHWNGPVLGFTATPDYSPNKDARKILPHVIEKGEIIPYIKDGILNGAQLFTFAVEPRRFADKMPEVDLENRAVRRQVGRELLNNYAIDFIKAQLDEGRRGIMFCESGGMAAHARALAERLSQLSIPDGNGGQRLVITDVIGAFRGKENRSIIDRYHSGEIDILCTTEKGKEGLNGEFDFVIINARVGSFLKLRQMVGRGTRLSKRFPITRYAEFVLPLDEDDESRFYSLTQVFGLDTVEQGYTVADGWQKEGQGSIKSLPPYLQEICRQIDGKKISEVLITPEVGAVEVPEGYVSLDEIVAYSGEDESLVANRLNRAGYHSLGQVELMHARRKFVRYYEPAAKTYFEENPIPPCAMPGDIPVGDLAEELGCSRNLIYRTLTGAREPVDRRAEKEHLRAVPHVLKQYADEFRAEFKGVLYAEPGDMNRREIADAAGVTWGMALSVATKDELAAARPRRKPNDNRTLPTWPKEIAEAIVERHKKRRSGLPAHVLPHHAAAAILPNAPRVVYQKLKKLAGTPESIILDGSRAACFTWGHIRQLAEESNKPVLMDLDYDRLPTSADDTDPEKIAYAQSIQRQLLPEVQLAEYEKIADEDS